MSRPGRRASRAGAEAEAEGAAEDGVEDGESFADFPFSFVGDWEGEEARSVPRLAASSPRPVSALPEVPPCCEGLFVGTSWACTRSPPPLSPPIR
ncbi:hypothetical protein RKD37_003087 [Streptomyces ambofaciens]